MHRLPLISAFVDPFDLLHWLSPMPRRRPPRQGSDAGPARTRTAR